MGNTCYAKRENNKPFEHMEPAENPSYATFRKYKKHDNLAGMIRLLGDYSYHKDDILYSPYPWLSRPMHIASRVGIYLSFYFEFAQNRVDPLKR